MPTDPNRETASASTPDPIEELMVQLLERDADAWPAALQRIETERPEVAAELRARLALLVGPVNAASGPPELSGFTDLVELGRGGMGIVFRAHEPALGRDVAVKVIRPERLFFDGAHARFRREVEATARLSHPGVVRIHSVGGLESGGIPHFAMELLGGASLAALVRRLEGRDPESVTGEDLVGPGGDPDFARLTGPRAVATLGAGVARALEHAHARGVLHRDVKPANVVLEADGRAVLLDFGLTSFAAEGASHATATGSTLGTLVYMAPEQVEGRAVGPAADVYGLGATLHELLTLEPPFAGANTAALRAAIAAGAIAPLRDRNPAVPRDLEAVVRKAVELRPGDRYASAQAFADDLERFLRREPVHASSPGALERGTRWARRRPAHASALVLALLLILGGPIAYAVLAGRHAGAMERVAAAERAAREDAERANADLETTLAFVTRMFDAAAPSVHGGDVPDAVEMVSRGAEVVASEPLTDRAEARVELLIGRLFSVLVRPGEAELHLARAVPLLRDLARAPDAGDADRARLAEGLRLLAHDRALSGRPTEAAPLLDEAEALLSDLYGPSSPRLHALLATRADVAEGARDVSGALAARERAVRVLEEGGASEEAIRLARGLVGVALVDVGRPNEAREALVEALAPGPFEDPERASQYDRLALELAEIEARAGNLEEALTRVEGTVERLGVRNGPESLLTLQAELQRGRVLGALGRGDEALRVLRPTTDALRTRLDGGHPLLVTADRDVVRTLGALGRSHEVVAYAEELDLVRRAGPGLGTGSWSHLDLLRTIGLSAQAIGRQGLAHRVLTELEDVERGVAPLGPGHVEAILLLVAHRGKTGEGPNSAEERGSAELLGEVIERAGDEPLAVRSTTNGRTFEAGTMARLFLAGLVDDVTIAARLRDEAAERERRFAR